MFDKDQTIAKIDPELWQSIQAEDQRQEQHIELIASDADPPPESIAIIRAHFLQLFGLYRT
jgi:glycine hydroxymethyltransferase